MNIRVGNRFKVNEWGLIAALAPTRWRTDEFIVTDIKDEIWVAEKGETVYRITVGMNTRTGGKIRVHDCDMIYNNDPKLPSWW